MLVLKINSYNIIKAIRMLKAGGIIVYPTDTAYALGGIFSSRKVIKKILKIKGRTDKKFTLIASSLNQVNKFFKLNAMQKKLAKKYWPGALSLAISPKFAVRVPDNEIAQILAKKCGYPLIATSANLTGQTDPYDAKKIVKLYQGRLFQPDLILDAGQLQKNKPSTIVKVARGKIIIIRPGLVKIKNQISKIKM